MLSIESKPPAFNNSMLKRYLYCSIDLDIMTLINMTMAKYMKYQICLNGTDITNLSFMTLVLKSDLDIMMTYIYTKIRSTGQLV